MDKFLVDTNIIIYHLNGDQVATDWLLCRQESLAISVITKIEVLSYPFEPEEEVLVLEFLKQFDLHYVTDEIIEATIQLRKKRKIKTPDAVIAATALVQGLHVCTRNISDFKNIGVNYINPFEEGDKLK
ncbi:MAG: type II toxin-antitoxin system VapC family toxin [Candidatus Electrothrix sp. EH2]|nr:type II toxin-antitoxin system VapC family toxin [Candidatus Electrothrix sp. EH2]